MQQTLNLDDIKPSTRVSSDDSVFQDLLRNHYGGATYGARIECFKVFSNTIFKFPHKPFIHFLWRLPMLSFNFICHGLNKTFRTAS